MDRTRLIISASVSTLIFVCAAAITGDILSSVILAGVAIVPIQVQGVLSDRASKRRAVEREARRGAMLSAEGEGR